MERHVAVFGASGGIGTSVVKRLLVEGAKVTAISRSPETTETTRADFLVKLEGNTWSDYTLALQKAHELMGDLNGVVNCIGSILLKPIHLVKECEFDEQVTVHLKSTAAILSAAVPLMRKSLSPEKSIVTISSIAASTGLANHEVISAVKGGIEAMTRSAAASYASTGIRINAVAPGLTQTKLTERIWKNEATRTMSEQNHPLKRLGNPEDITNAIYWLISSQSNWITGEVIHVDGGMSNIQNLKA